MRSERWISPPGGQLSVPSRPMLDNAPPVEGIPASQFLRSPRSCRCPVALAVMRAATTLGGASHWLGPVGYASARPLVSAALLCEADALVRARPPGRALAINTNAGEALLITRESQRTTGGAPPCREGLELAFTFFFRDQQVLERVVEHSLPGLSGRSHPRIWDAGVAMGQESYTLSIMFAERMGHFAFKNLRIDATDVESTRPVRPNDRGGPVSERGVVAVARGHPGEDTSNPTASLGTFA